ncbi:hypothetical protein HOY82DRAFT_549152 [Tuber indicum]|nr:hypothetical protein HOY82DRAFT_549152 [Tuber indicum]
MYRRAFVGAEEMLGVDHRDTLLCIYNLAGALSKRGKYYEAEMMYWRALAGRERVLGPGHPHTLRCIIKLVAVLYDQRKFGAAETMYQRAVTRGEETLGPHYREALSNASCLAMFLRARGSSTTAELSLSR